MPLTAADFEGFDLGAARDLLRSFDSWTRQKGEKYYRSGAVNSLNCREPGLSYVAKVQGGRKYEVSFNYDEDWDADCTCPVGYECKHIFAALRQLLDQQSALSLGNGAGPQKMPPRKSQPGTFALTVQEKLGRDLAGNELTYLKSVDQLFKKSVTFGLNYRNELTGLGLKQNDVGYWDRLELYPSPPRSEAEFWNYLALYLTETARCPVPEFMRPVTDLDKARATMRKHFRARDIERWKQTLNQVANLSPANQPDLQTRVELRARFLSDKIALEWRPDSAANWVAIKPGKTQEFDARYGPRLSAEAALLWLPYFQRTRIQYSNNFDYDDSWVIEQVGRWLRQPLLRPLLANELGEPLVFHEEPLQWQVIQPEDTDGDYSFSLVQSNGNPVPHLMLASRAGTLSVYLTSMGVFSGPPFEDCVMAENNVTLIPARALESPAGVHLLAGMQIAPPPRLAARIRTVKLFPAVRAEVSVPWSGPTEYCHMDILGVSEDGRYVEGWAGNGWVPKDYAGGKDNGFIQIDRTALAALARSLEGTAFKWDFQWQRWQLRVSKKFAEQFVAFLKALPADTRIDLAGDLASFQNAEVAGKIRLDASEAGMDWFDLRVIVDVSDTSLTKEEIKLLLDAKGNWVRLEDKGWRKLAFTLTEEEDRELARLGLTPHELTSEPQRLHAFQLADKAARKFLPEETCERVERRAAELQASVTPAVPSEIQAELRPYQRDGFHFLAYLSTNHFGGILADDMGLGKTVQTLAWLAWLRNETVSAKESAPRPSLVVCPKSVADNWHAEAVKFFPGLKVRVWPARDLKSFAGNLSSADLHVLNYSQLRLVAEDLVRETFQALILDEGQYIKNPSSQTAQLARQLRAEHRIVLSGTPIENRLLDLWSLMAFAMPGALGSRAEFGRLYDAKNDPFARQRLSARVRPFVIRRTKAQVARDLPDRIEEDLYCELEGEQKKLYRAELKRAQAMLLGVKTAAALNKQRFNFLTSLLRLRQICCHPRLAKPDSVAPSAKVEALMETLEPLVEEGQKVLVFSQFVELLDILRKEIKGRNWTHWCLSGETENRGDIVKEFQSAEGSGVFLISLKAGGFGLNLTAASYVVLFDPWWNPAVENQAIDRTHRIGQDRKVIAYRLLIKDSIEEKIRALQRKKKALAEDVLGEERFSQGLSLDDLRYLLQD